MQLSSALRILLPIGAVAGMLALAALAGRRLTRAWRWRDALEALVVSTTLGLAGLGLVLCLLGLAGGLRRAPLAVAAALIVAWAAPAWRPLCEDVRAAARLAIARRWGLLVALPFLAVGAGVLYCSLYPPTHFDSTLYHLPYVRRSLETGRLPYDADLRFPIFPQLAETLFTGVVLFSNELAAQVLNAAITALGAAVLALWARALKGGPTAWSGVFAAAVWLGGPLALELATSAYVEPALVLWTAATGLLAVRFVDRRDDGWLHAAAFCAGSAAATRHTGLAVAVGLLGWVAYHRLGWRRFATTVAMASLAAGPWYLRLLVLTGNPVFPLFNSLFRGYSGHNPRFQIRTVSPFGPLAAIRQQLGVLIEHALWHGGRTGVYSPALALVPPLAIWAVPCWRRSRALLAAALFFIVAYQWWDQEPRHLVIAALFLTIVVAGGLAAPLDRWEGRWRPALGVALTALLLVPGAVWLAGDQRFHSLPPLSAAARDEYLGRVVPGYKAIQFLNREKGSAYSVYVLPGENLAYYAAGDFAGDFFGRKKYAVVFPALGDAEWLFAKLRAMEADHLILRMWSLPRRLPDTPEFRRRFRLIYEDPYNLVYELLIEAPR